MRRKAGLLFTALSLKQCGSSLQKAYGGDPSTGLLPFPVSLTRKGYPTIIPSFHRKMIYSKDEKADMLVQLSLSWFSLAKVIQLAKPIGGATFESIVSLPKDQQSIHEVMAELKTFGRELIDRYIPGVSSIPISQGITWEPTWKAVPNVRFPAIVPKQYGKVMKSGFLALTYELGAYGTMLQIDHSMEGFFSSACLWRERVDVCSGSR